MSAKVVSNYIYVTSGNSLDYDRVSVMADDQFTAQVEHMLRVRRETRDILRLIRDVRRVLINKHSIQEASSIRHWDSEEVAKMYDDLERVSSLLDSSMGRYLEGPAVSRRPALPEAPEAVKMVKIHGVLVADNVEDKRPIKGPGRRHGYIRQ